MAILFLLIALGLASVAGAVISAQTSIAAKRDASIANNAILQEVRLQNYDLCQRAERIAGAAGLPAEDCPVPGELAPNPPVKVEPQESP